jgi:hypothetical protein
VQPSNPSSRNHSLNTSKIASRRSRAVRHATLEYLGRIRKFLASLAKEAGIRDADAFARKWHMIMKGAIVSACEGDREAGARAREIATLVIDDALGLGTH